MQAEVEIDVVGHRLVLSGDVDVRSTERVRAALEAVIDSVDPVEGDGLVVVDLAEVTSVDIVALRVLAAASCRAGSRGRRLVLRSPSPVVRRLLHLTHLIRVVELEAAPV